MVHIVGVFGEWMMNKESWNFNVNNKKGGKLFTIRDNLKFDEMVEMVVEDFGIDRLSHEEQLSYVLPETMLENMPKDTPPIFVNNDRQLETLWEICRSVSIRLCISVKNSYTESQDYSFEIPMVSRKGAAKKT
ncbi:unnamed protein product [Arabis nemorensis]|uniref:Uncharacterized protein n=1 Tax=Arabis nemorensis TaxID=586526 RepID=A0A565AV81_9BRAS|nr:unnamed protein product [Arabis nemorensis]